MSHIEYFYSTHSAFAYLGSAQLAEIARTAGRLIVQKPINLRPVMQAARGDGFGSFSVAHRVYFFGARSSVSLIIATYLPSPNAQ
jgi:2-hydroxychromene-2-carboxylate isomerase